MKGLDHAVLCVNDLDMVASQYKKLGFTVTPRAKHPFGTHNCIVQLDGFFLELLTVAEPEKIPDAKEGVFSFPRYNQHYLSNQQGFAAFVMDSDDFRLDHQVAIDAGLDTYPVFEFSRDTTLPNNDVVEVSFGLNFVSHPKMPMASFFTCQQFQPQYFWNKEYQRHDNGASQIIEVCLVAAAPQDFASFFAAFTQCKFESGANDSIVINTKRGRVLIATPSEFERRYGNDVPDITHGPQLAGLTIGGSDMTNQSVYIAGTTILFKQT